MADSERSHFLGRPENVFLLLLASAKVILHLVTSAVTDYGYFIDEFYYIACSKRLAFGYVDHPPLSIWLLAASRWLLGDSLAALRFLPALAGGGTVFLAGLIARRLGGKIPAQLIAACAVFASPVNLLMSSFYSMNPFELFFWTLCGYVLIDLFTHDKPRLWVWVGVLVGVGLEFKHTMVLYLLTLLAGMLLTPARKYFLSRWFWIGWAVAGSLVLPNLIWQWSNGFPSLEFYGNAMLYKNIPTSPLGVLAGQFLFTNPVVMLVGVAGLGYFLRAKETGLLRMFGYSYLLLLLIMIISQSSRPDRIMSAYPVLFAGGGVLIERFSDRLTRRWLVPVAAALVIIAGIVTAPISVPILPPQTLIRYMSAIGFKLDIEKGKSAQLPQWFADRFGWKEMVAEVARVYHALPAEEQADAVIFAGSYGQAGAIELFGDQYGLPCVESVHNTYALWGPCSDSAQTYIFILVQLSDIQSDFESVEQAGLHVCNLAMEYESRVPVYVARGPKFSMREVWPRIKHYE